MATLNELFETYINDNYEGTMSQAAIVKAYELLLGLTGNFADKAARVQYWVDKDLAVSEFLDEFLAAAARLSEENAAAWGETTTERTAVVNAAQNAVSTSLSLEEVGTVVANARASFDPQSFNLTTGVDQGTDFTGGVADDTFTARNVDVSGADSNALSALDALDGGAGNDTLAIIDTTADGLDTSDASGLTLTGIESVTVRSANAATVDLSTQTDVTSVAVTTATTVDFAGSDTQSLSVSGATGAVVIDGGDAITVSSSATTNSNITIGGGTVSAGSVTVTDTDQGTGTIAIDGGTDVTVTTTSEAAGNITVGAGGAAADMASGAVSITQNLENDATGALTGGTIDVTGGSTVDVTVNANSVADTSADDNNITVGAISVTGYNNTTAVTVTQNDNVTQTTSDDEGGNTETASVKFGVLKSGDALAVGGLTFTASKDLTAAEVAAAFASIAATETQGAGGSVENGVFTGSLTGWSGAAASTDTVVFTSTTEDTNVADLTPALTNSSSNSVAPVVTTTAGGALTASADASLNDVVFSAVTIADGGTDSLATVSLDGYGNSTVTSDALTSLTLANGEGTMGVTTANTSLDLSLQDVDGAVTVDANVTTLNVTTTTETSTGTLAATGVTTLTVNADVNSTGAVTFGALETVDINGAGSFNMGDISGDTALTTFDASGNTGGVTATISANSATVTGGITDYVFSAGNDTVTLSEDTADIDVTLGEGDDTLVLNTDSTTVPTGSITGGAGTDTIEMTLTSAAGLDGNSNFATAASGFERLHITDAPDMDAGAITLDLEALGFSYVTTTGATDNDGANSGTQQDLTLDNMASGGTVVMTAAQTGSDIVVNVKDAATGDADVLNIITNTGDDAAIDVGTLIAAEVETINLTATDTDVDEDGNGEEYEVAADRDLSTLDLDAVDATSVVIDGNAHVSLDMTGNVAATTIDASALTGGLTVTSYADDATVTGGTGDDTLTASGDNNVLLGGAGDDTLTGGDLSTLTGGEGADTFVMNIPTNVNSYSTITDLSSGDIIDLDSGNAGTVVFSSSAITLAETAVFQDFANAAVNALGADTNNAAWFQYDNSTFIIQSGADHTSTADFQNGTDAIIQISGLVDLSTASYNQTYGTLEIA